MGLKSGIKLFYEVVKPGKRILQTEGHLGCKGHWQIQNKEITTLTQAYIGDVSTAVAENASKVFKGAFSDIEYMFCDLAETAKIIGRSKSALSTQTKIKKFVLKNNGLKSLNEGMKFIDDAVGTRVILKSSKKLSKKQISSQIEQTSLNGKKLSNRQIELLEKYIYEKPIDAKDQAEAFQLYKEFVKPLVEKRSQSVVDRLSIGCLAYRIKSGNITLAQIKKEKLIDETLISKLEKSINTGDFAPINITKINNYRGPNGIAEFSDSQMHQLNYAMGKSSATAPIVKRNATSSRYNYIKDTTSLENSNYAYNEPSSAIKASGYRTSQMKIVHENGALDELQFRGPLTNEWAEYEHIAYDLRQGKNTLGDVFNEYAEVVSKLPDSQYQIYNNYLESCYNYFNRLELGLPAKKPILPNTLNKILSMDSMKSLHIKDEKTKEITEKTFKPYKEYVNFESIA